MKFNTLASTVALAGGLALAAPAHATFIVDDFNTSTGYSIADTTADGSHAGSPPYSQGTGNSLVTGITAGNTVWGSVGGGAGIGRTIYAELDIADTVETQVCDLCNAGHIISGAGLTFSLGNYWFDWTGPSQDLSTLSRFAFDWGADLAGVDWYVEFVDDNGVIATTAEQMNLPSAASLSHSASVALPAFAPGTVVGYANIERIRLNFNGVGALDANIDNVRVIPEPASLALMGLGLAGLALGRRRRAS